MDIKEEREEMIDEKMAQVPPVVFPDVQRVEVINREEQVQPVIHVAAPIVNVPESRITVQAPQVTIDNSEVAQSIASLQQAIENIPKPSNQDIIEALDEYGKNTLKGMKGIKVYGGNGGVASNIYNAQSAVINPATEEKQESMLNLWTDSARFDSFSRLRTSNPVTLFDAQLTYELYTVHSI